MSFVYESYSRIRLLVAVAGSIIFHMILFIIFQNFNLISENKIEEYSGPVYVTLDVMEERPVQKKAQGILKTSDRSRITDKAEESVPNPASAAKLTENLSKQVAEKATNTSVSQAIVKAGNDTAKVQNFQSSLYPSTNKEVSLIKKGERASVTVNDNKGLISGIQEERPKVNEQKVKGNEEEEKAIPFKPGVEIEEEPLAFNMEELKQEGGTKSAGVNVKVQTPESGYSKGFKSEYTEGTEDIENSKVIWERPGIKRKVISYGPKPDIPEWVKKEGLKLEITLLFNVDPEGHVLGFKVLESSGYTEIDALMMESVRRIVFEPIPVDRIDRARITYIILPS